MPMEPSERIDLLQGTLDMLILRTLLVGPAHGHQIAKHIERTTDDVLRVDHGSLYPALHRLVRNGWIAAGRGQAPPRHRPGHAARRGNMTFDDELDREIRDHLELEAEAQRALGAADDDARDAARRRFGNVGLVKEAVRATRWSSRFDGLRQDLRYAWRGLLRSPAFTATAV